MTANIRPYTVKSILQLYNGSGALVSSTNYNYVSHYQLNSAKTSVNTGKFTPGEYRVNPYYVSRQKVEGGAGLANVQWKSGLYTFVFTDIGDISGKFIQDAFSQFSAPDYTNLGQLAVQRAYRNVGQAKANLGENLGEIVETIRMINQPLKSLRDFLLDSKGHRLNLLNKYLRYLRNGDWHQGIGKGELNQTIGAAKAAADSWLEFRYGWRPLLLSLCSVVDVLTTQVEALNKYKIYTSGSKISRDVDLGRKDMTPGGYQSISYLPTLVGKDKVSIFARVQYRRVNLPTLPQRLSLSPEYVPELLWELTRLSFVVDWLFSVGSWLGSLRINPDVQILGHTLGIKVERQLTLNLSAYYSSDPNKKQLIEKVNLSHETYTRTVGSSPPALPLFTQFEGFTSAKAIDSAALLAQNFLHYIKR